MFAAVYIWSNLLAWILSSICGIFMGRWKSILSCFYQLCCCFAITKHELMARFDQSGSDLILFIPIILLVLWTFTTHWTWIKKLYWLIMMLGCQYVYNAHIWMKWELIADVTMGFKVNRSRMVVRITQRCFSWSYMCT